MTEDFKADLDLNTVVIGVGNKPEKDLIGQSWFDAKQLEEMSKNAKDLSVGRLIWWMLSEGLPMEKSMDLAKKTMRLIDKIDDAFTNNQGIWKASEDDISKLEELIGKVEHQSMNIGKYKIAIARLLELGKDLIGQQRLSQKKQ